MNSAMHTPQEKSSAQRASKAANLAYQTPYAMDSAERERLLLEQLPQVRYIAKRIHDRLPKHVLLEDLINAGVLGLIEAVHKFDPTKNVELKSYAKHRIHGAILDSLRDLDWSPRPLRRKARQVEEAQQKIRARLGRPATESEVAEELGMELADLQHLLGDLRGLDLGSLQVETTTEDGREREITHYLPNAPDEDPFFLCLRSEMKQLLSQAIAELPERERQLLALYYFEELTMKEVGAVLGVGEARVSQIHSAALTFLRSRLKELLKARPPQRTKPSEPDASSLEAAWKSL
jgi:RNA polymerase sigma factor for flagellar operon FliA